MMANVNKEVGDALSSLSVEDRDNIFDGICKQNMTATTERLKEVFDVFDIDGDGFLNKVEFSILLEKLFSKEGKPYQISEKLCVDILKLLDENQDGKIDVEEFTVAWYHWLKQILDPVSALIIVDVQNDFIDGTMAIRNCPAGQEGAAVIPPINAMLEDSNFDVVVYSYDWHPENHISFTENLKTRKMHHTSKVTTENAKSYDTVVFAGPPIMEQKLWPAHCIQNSWGSRLHEEVQVVSGAIHINKGTNPEIDSYSAFWDNKKMSQTTLVANLTQRNVTDVYVCGVAYDVCVGSTAIHALEHGFRTVLVEDASRGVNLEDIEAMREKLQRGGAAVVNSENVKDMVACVDRRPELGYAAAKNVALARKLLQQESNVNSIQNKTS